MLTFKDKFLIKARGNVKLFYQMIAERMLQQIKK